MSGTGTQSHRPRAQRPRGLRVAIAGALVLGLGLGLRAWGIEMFTNFGDGSRIGLPNLEVPVQAYPGIPLRSDRIRARARAQQSRAAQVPNGGQAGAAPQRGVRPGVPGGGITVRPMNPAQARGAFPVPPPPAGATGGPVRWQDLPGQTPTRQTLPGAPHQPTTNAKPGSVPWSSIVPQPPQDGIPSRNVTPSARPAPPSGQPEVVPLPGFDAPVFPGDAGRGPVGGQNTAPASRSGSPPPLPRLETPQGR